MTFLIIVATPKEVHIVHISESVQILLLAQMPETLHNTVPGHQVMTFVDGTTECLIIYRHDIFSSLLEEVVYFLSDAITIVIRLLSLHARTVCIHVKST